MQFSVNGCKPLVTIYKTSKLSCEHKIKIVK